MEKQCCRKAEGECSAARLKYADEAQEPSGVQRYPNDPPAERAGRETGESTKPR